jgi:hypothetical protein
MKGWGRVVFLVSAGIFTFAGCGGRTGMLGDDFYDPDEGGSSFGNTGSGGTKASAGKPSKGGKGSGGAASPSGGVSYGGYPIAGGYPGGFPAFGGAFPSFGGAFPTGGAFPVGGFGGGVPIDCQSCIFKTCNAELSQCFQDVGCLSIFACTATSGCQGFDCYTPEACAGVIDQWGGPGGPSMSAMLKAFSCVLTSGCPCN